MSNEPRTPQHHVDKVNAMVAMLTALPSVERVFINDWGRFSNFDVWVDKKKVWVNGKLRNGSYRPAIAAMKKFCKQNGMIYRGHHIPYKTDYHQNLHVDIDFQQYHVESNSFG
jgi:hypothetical protein